MLRTNILVCFCFVFSVYAYDDQAFADEYEPVDDLRDFGSRYLNDFKRTRRYPSVSTFTHDVPRISRKHRRTGRRPNKDISDVELQPPSPWIDREPRGRNRGHHVRRQHRRGRPSISDFKPGRHINFLDIYNNGLDGLYNWERLAFRLGIPDWLNGEFDFDFDVEFGRNADWWQGPHVCKKVLKNNQRKGNPSSSFFFTKVNTCTDKGEAYVCNTVFECGAWKNTSTVTYTCCSGHSHRQGEAGCQHEVELKNIVDVAKDLKLSEFLKAVSTVGLNESLTNWTVTLFTPPNDKWKSYTTDQDLILKNLVILSPETRIEADHAIETVLHHIIPNTELSTYHMINDMIVPTALPNSPVRINKYRKSGVVTVNCVKVISADNFASNGVIHVVEEILQPVTKNLMQLLEETGQHKRFLEVLRGTEWNETLSGTDTFTILAPTDAAFAKLGNDNLKRLLIKDECLEHFIGSHIIPEIVCPSGVTTQKHQTFNLNKKRLYFERDGLKLIVSSEAKVTSHKVGLNGVVLLVDNVLGTESLSPLRLAASEDGNQFVNLIKNGKFSSYMESLKNVTFFIPTNDAMMQVSEEKINALKGDTVAMKELLNYHTVRGSFSHRNLRKRKRKLVTLDGNRTLTVGNLGKYPRVGTSVQCASVVKINLKTCSSNHVFLVDKVMFPPTKGNLLQTLEADPRFTTFVSLLKRFNLANIIETDSVLTILAPTNEALFTITRMSSVTRHMMKEFLKSHILLGTECCNSLSSPFRAGSASASGRYLFFRHDASGSIRVGGPLGGARIRECDITATNGIIHAVDPALRLDRKTYTIPEGFFDIFD